MGGLESGLAETDATKIFFTDLNGRIMSLPVNPDNMDRILKNGIGFDGSSVPGYARVENSDRLLFPVPDTFRVIRFSDEKLGFFIGSIYNEEGKRAQADPRAALENVLARAKEELGFQFAVGPEHEFFVLTGDEFRDGIHSDKAGYCQATPHDKGEVVRNRVISILKGCGIAFEKAHHEVTPSQHEINLDPADPLTAADRTVLFNYVTQKAAQELGYHATFMPKPFDGYNRNAFHIHVSMQDREGNNLFYEKGGDHELSQTARHFIGGILKYARETSIIMASTFNSYKAYVIEREAPIIRNWGYSNRSSMVRIPFTDSPRNQRLELRNPDPAGNVYLQMAVLIAMGMEGVKEKIDSGKSISGSTYKRNVGARVWDKRFLPRSMYEALVEAEKSRFLKRTLGERLYSSYMGLKVREWEGHRTHVTGREHDLYLSR